MAKRDRGTGSVWEPKGSRVFWCQYYIHGKRQRESTGETTKRKAINFLSKHLQEVAAGTRTAETGKMTVAQLIQTKLETDRNNGSKSVDDSEDRWLLHLKPFFGGMKASHVNTPLLTSYIAERRKTEIVRRYKTKSREVRIHKMGKFPSNAQINRELALLRAAFNLGKKSGIVTNVPHFPMLQENNVRKGFLKDEHYTRMAQECAKVGLWLRGLFEVHFTYGWRREEVLTLRVNQIDKRNRTIDLEPGTTKNKDARVIKMTQKVFELVSALIERKEPSDLVFTWEDGSPIKDYRDTWRSVCEAAGVPDLLVHDLRRTGARNMRRLGIAENVIMKVGGWKTRSVFERYNIVDERDLVEAAQLLDQKQATLENSQRIAKEAQQEVQPSKTDTAIN